MQERNQQMKPHPKSKPTKRINLPYVQNISENIRRNLSNNNIHATFYTQSKYRNLLDKPKGPVPLAIETWQHGNETTVNLYKITF